MTCSRPGQGASSAGHCKPGAFSPCPHRALWTCLPGTCLGTAQTRGATRTRSSMGRGAPLHRRRERATTWRTPRVPAPQPSVPRRPQAHDVACWDTSARSQLANVSIRRGLACPTCVLIRTAAHHRCMHCICTRASLCSATRSSPHDWWPHLDCMTP